MPGIPRGYRCGGDDSPHLPRAARRSGSRADPGQPLVTAYDDATGERTELSVTTYANWVSKTANLFIEELDLDAGDTVLLDLPPHWLVPVFLGAAWSAGLAVTTTPRERTTWWSCGPDTLAQHAALRRCWPARCCPSRCAFAEPLPGGVLDYGLLWPGQSDVFFGHGPPGPDTLAWRSEDRPPDPGGPARGSRGRRLRAGVRLLTDVHPAEGHGVPAFLGAVGARRVAWCCVTHRGRADVGRSSARTSGPRPCCAD